MTAGGDLGWFFFGCPYQCLARLLRLLRPLGFARGPGVLGLNGVVSATLDHLPELVFLGIKDDLICPGVVAFFFVFFSQCTMILPVVERSRDHTLVIKTIGPRAEPRGLGHV